MYTIEEKRNRILIKVLEDRWNYVGYLKYRIKKHDKNTKYVYIDLISVEDLYRNQGYATAMVDYLYKKYTPDLYIEVEHMTPMGYKFFTSIKDYYPMMVLK
jgi:ribosomal protein S18 acetylase RimI-like enzyme